MNDYDKIRHFADSYGLVAMMFVFVVFILWPFRPGKRGHYDEAASLIFTEDNETSSASKDKSHG
ncbi:MAG TPA: cbb3-type cytochrome c oxidase subunit 3 [Sphingobium sp.]|nr:cbb3-type cytochrome c oxidase subunit 3 [Sphingobium sp.]